MKLWQSLTAVSLITILSASFAFAANNQSPQPSESIRLNSLGFLPTAQKKATIISKCKSFNVRDLQTNKKVFSGYVTGPITQADVNQTAWFADFSKVNKPGKYYIEVPNVGRSIDFEISETVYDKAFITCMRAFYLWRCGTEVNAIYNGNRFYHAACHTEDAWDSYITDYNSQYINILPPDAMSPDPLDPNAHGPKIHRDGTGGWHDAGDYNKYIVNAGVTMGAMFWAWEQFGDKLKNVNLGIPDTAPGYPDYLKELKWETDWILKMQYPDNSGRVFHKVSTLRFGGFILPEQETEKRYFVEYSTAATADFVAELAMAARFFKPYDEKYAQKCLDAAKKSFGFLRQNRENKMSDPNRQIRTGSYPTNDLDDRLWAAAELWETTGDANYLRFFERGQGAFEDKIDFFWDWGSVKNLAMFTYLFSKREGKRDTLVEDIKRDLLRTADTLVRDRDKDIYGRCLGGQYKWGCNGTVARECITLMMANRVSPNPEYVNTALDAIGHLFGRNFYFRSYVTGVGYKPPMNPHDRRCGGDNVRDPWPGYVVGGGHSATDWQDIEPDARTNEICINWQSALVYALAGFTSGK